MKNLRVVFMGTPEFAVATLGSLLLNGYEVVSVVTSPDKPAGRGRTVTKSAVCIFAEENNLPLLQPENLKDPGLTANLQKLNADVFVVVAFRMLPKNIWEIPAKGTINLHASLLPQYRGAAPINHVLINGEMTTGVTTFLIDDKIDTGNILLRQEVSISPSENAGTLHDKLMKHGAALVIQTLDEIKENSIIAKSQTEYMLPGENLKPAPKIFPDFCKIDWTGNPGSLYNFIRGLSPYPGAKSVFTNASKNISFKIYDSLPESGEHNLDPGQILSDGRKYLRIACKGGYLKILSLQLEGKKRLDTEEFLKGFRIDEFKVVTN